MAERRGSNGKRGWGGLGCHEWSSVDMVMSLFLCVCVCVCVHVQMCAPSKVACGFVLFCVVSFLRLFPVSLSLRLPFVLTWKKFCYQMGTRSPFRVSFHRRPCLFFHHLFISASFLGLTFIYYICIPSDLFIWKLLSVFIGLSIRKWASYLCNPLHNTMLYRGSFRTCNILSLHDMKHILGMILFVWGNNFTCMITCVTTLKMWWIEMNRDVAYLHLKHGITNSEAWGFKVHQTEGVLSKI